MEEPIISSLLQLLYGFQYVGTGTNQVGKPFFLSQKMYFLFSEENVIFRHKN